MFSSSLLKTGCLSQIKPITSVTHQYVNNVLTITIEITFAMPYHGLIVYPQNFVDFLLRNYLDDIVHKWLENSI